VFDFPWLRHWSTQDFIAFIATVSLVVGLSNLSFGGRRGDAHMKKRGQIEAEHPDEN
jgi:hypothetical protein